MKRRSIAVLLTMIMLASVAVLNCSRDDTAVVRLRLQNMPRSSANNPNSIVERLFRWFVNEAWAFQHWQSITTIECVISAPDLEEMSFSLPATETELTVEVPAGPARRITVYAGDVFPKDFGGHVELDLNPGDEVDAVINMVPTTSITNCMYTGSSVMVYWGAVSPPYGIAGYNVYRSDVPEGPYFAACTAPAPDAMQCEDLSGPFVTSTNYYYRVSAYTAGTEGEMSAYYDFYLS